MASAGRHASAAVMTGLPIASAADARRATWHLVREDGRGMAAVLAWNVPAAAAALAGPWLLGLILDRVQRGEPIGLLPLAAVAAAVAQLLLLRTARRAALRFGERASARLRERFVARVLALPISMVERAGTGDLATRATTDVAGVGETVRDVVPEVLVSALQGLFTIVALFLIDPLLGLCVPVGVAAIPVVTRWYLRRARDAYLTEGSAGSEMAEQLTATAVGARTVEAFGLAEDRVARGVVTTAQAWRARMATLRLRSVFFPVCDVAYVVPVALVLVLGGMRYIDGAVAFGAVAAAALYAISLSDPFDRILERIEQLQSSAASMARIAGVDGIAAAPVAPAVPVGDRVEVRGVHFAYDDGPPVLHGVDLVVEPGERLAVVGTSGAGKSTLGRLLAGLDTPGTGRVLLGGVDVVAGGGTLLVTQEQHVFLGTLRDNLAVAAPDADDETMRRAATVAGIGLPLGTELGAGALVLDAATAQQVALARVLLADPPVVVLDEATALLDPTTARHTERRLAKVLSGRTVIAVAHRLHTAHDADRIVVMDRGRIVEDGTHDALVDAGGPYAALWRSWQGMSARD